MVILKVVFFFALLIVSLLIYGYTYPVEWRTTPYRVDVLPRQHYAPLSEKELDRLNKTFGHKKNLPVKFRDQILLALSHYPELVNHEITFQIVRKSPFPLVSRPELTSLLNPGARRRYLVLINDDSTRFSSHLLLKNIPFNAQIGILGHELSHTASYSKMSAAELAALGIKYLSDDFREDFEKSTDRHTIYHGLGWQLLEFSKYVRSKPLAKKEKLWILKNYLSPIAIEDQMKQLDVYNIEGHGKNKQEKESLQNTGTSP